MSAGGVRSGLGLRDWDLGLGAGDECRVGHCRLPLPLCRCRAINHRSARALDVGQSSQPVTALKRRLKCSDAGLRIGNSLSDEANLYWSHVAREASVRGKSATTLALEAAILDIVEERAPITVRGVAYALFTRSLIPSMETNHTARVSRIMTAMREDKTLDWRKIVDGSRPSRGTNTWSDPDSIIRAAVEGYRRNYWQDQPVVVEVWSEKSTVEGILQPVLDEFGVEFRVMKGFSSFTQVMGAVVAANRFARRGQKLIVLYIGDWDPSGLYMSAVDLPDRLARYGGKVQLKRIALVKSDTTPRLPFFSARTKNKDPRYDWFVANHGPLCWEIDAMDTNVLRDRVRKQIVRYIDPVLWERAREVETAEVESMHDFHAAWQSRLTRTP
jgi:hypothetical protein